MSASRDPVEVVAVRGLERSFQAGDQVVRALRGVSFTIHQGEFVAIMGPSGSGKSTLLYQLGCLDRPTSGVFRICGEEPQGMDDTQLSDLRKRTIGFVFQSFNLLSRATILQNVVLPMRYAGIPRREARDRAVSLLTRVGLGDRLDHRPTELSGGQCQRAAIARALANDPPVLLADEPTGNLDQKTGREIMALFHELREEGKTLVMVTHDEKLSRNTTRILWMRDGLLEGDEVLVDGSCPSRKPLVERHRRHQERRQRQRRGREGAKEGASRSEDEEPDRGVLDPREIL